MKVKELLLTDKWSLALEYMKENCDIEEIRGIIKDAIIEKYNFKVEDNRTRIFTILRTWILFTFHESDNNFDITLYHNDHKVKTIDLYFNESQDLSFLFDITVDQLIKYYELE